MTRVLGVLASAALIAFGTPGTTQASLIGQTVNCFDLGGGEPTGVRSCAPASAVVGAGQEFVAGGDNIGVDVGDGSIIFSGLDSVEHLGSIFFLSLTDLIQSDDPTAILIGIANFSATDVIGIEESDVSVFDNAIVLDYNFSQWSADSVVSFDLVFSQRQLPEPASIALFGLGLAGLGVAARRRKAI